MPVDVVTDGVSVMVDVPCGVPITCGAGIFWGTALPPAPPHPAASKTPSDARQASAAMRSKPAIELERCLLAAQRSSAKSPQHTTNDNTCSQTNGGTFGVCSGGTNIVLAVVVTVTT